MRQELRAGDVAHVPAGVPHQMLVSGEQTISCLVVKIQGESINLDPEFISLIPGRCRVAARSSPHVRNRCGGSAQVRPGRGAHPYIFFWRRWR